MKDVARYVRIALLLFVLLLAAQLARGAVLMSITLGTESIYLHDVKGNCPKRGEIQALVAEYRDTSDGEREFGCYYITQDGKQVVVHFPRGSYANQLIVLPRQNFKLAI